MDKKRMTRYEKVSIVVSACAAIISLATPLITYSWLDPTLQALKHRKPLVVDKYIVYNESGPAFKLEIQNSSIVPAIEIKVVITIDTGDTQESLSPKPFMNPPSPSDIEIKGNVATLMIKRALGPNETIEVIIPWIKGFKGKQFEIDDAYVYSDFGLAIHRSHLPRDNRGGRMGEGGGKL